MASMSLSTLYFWLEPLSFIKKKYEQWQRNLVVKTKIYIFTFQYALTGGITCALQPGEGFGVHGVCHAVRVGCVW